MARIVTDFAQTFLYYLLWHKNKKTTSVSFQSMPVAMATAAIHFGKKCAKKCPKMGNFSTNILTFKCMTSSNFFLPTNNLFTLTLKKKLKNHLENLCGHQAQAKWVGVSIYGSKNPISHIFIGWFLEFLPRCVRQYICAPSSSTEQQCSVNMFLEKHAWESILPEALP